MNTTQKSFKSTFSPDERIQQSQLALQKYPDHVPVIVEKYNKCKLQQLQKTLHLIRKEVTGNYLFLKNQYYSIVLFQLSKCNCSNLLIYLKIKHCLYSVKKPSQQNVSFCLQLGQNFEQLYLKYKDPIDGFLYLYYTDIDPFGF